MIQYIIVGILIIISLIYLGRILFRSFKGQATCETGCAKCSDIEQSIGTITQKK